MANLLTARGALPFYMIGNSLTMDSVPHGGLAAISSEIARYLSPGYHIRASGTLQWILDNPEDAVSSDLQGGFWIDALPARARKLFTFQPFVSGVGTGDFGNDRDAIRAFLDAIEAGPSRNYLSFIYQAWPSLTAAGGNYRAYWDGAYSIANDATPMLYKRAYFDALFPVSGCTGLIPIGEAFYSFDAMAAAGHVDGVASVDDLHRDDFHMGTAGRLLASLTVVATWCKRKPIVTSSVVAMYQSFGGSAVTLTQDLADQLAEIAWDTVRADPRTGVS